VGFSGNKSRIQEQPVSETLLKSDKTGLGVGSRAESFLEGGNADQRLPTYEGMQCESQYVVHSSKSREVGVILEKLSAITSVTRNPPEPSFRRSTKSLLPFGRN